MNFIIKLFDRGLFALTNWRASKFPRQWEAFRSDGKGKMSLGELTQSEAIEKLTKDTAHKIRYVDPDQAVIIYD